MGEEDLVLWSALDSRLTVQPIYLEKLASTTTALFSLQNLEIQMHSPIHNSQDCRGLASQGSSAVCSHYGHVGVFVLQQSPLNLSQADAKPLVLEPQPKMFFIVSHLFSGTLYTELKPQLLATLFQ